MSLRTVADQGEASWLRGTAEDCGLGRVARSCCHGVASRPHSIRRFNVAGGSKAPPALCPDALSHVDAVASFAENIDMDANLSQKRGPPTEQREAPPTSAARGALPLLTFARVA
jgi:hypothetical protein